MKLPVISGCLAAAFAVVTASALAQDQGRDGDNSGGTATPIKHLVVIFQENISYDHYFGTYPNAQNLSGETPFKGNCSPDRWALALNFTAVVTSSERRS
jgi:phospholipase C